MQNQQKLALANGETLKDFYPQGIDWNIEIPGTDIVSFLKEAIANGGKAPALEFMGTELTYQQLDGLIDRAAKGFQDMGVGRGSKVGLYMPNTPYYPIMFLGALQAGATVVNYDLTHSESKLSEQAQDSGTDIMVVTDLKEYFDKTKDLLDQNIVEKMVVCRFAEMLPFIKGLAFPLVRDVVKQDPQDKRQIAFDDLTNNDGKFIQQTFDPDETALLQYTGGTTGGSPKGAMLSHRNLVANILQIVASHQTTLKFGQERFLAALPQYHVYSMTINMLCGLHLGAKIVQIPDPTDLKTTLKTIRKHNPTVFPVVPKQLMGLLEHTKVKPADYHSIKLMISGGAPLPVPLRDAFEKASGIKITQGFGASETSPVTAVQFAEADNHPDSVGYALPGTEIKIVEILPDYAPDIWPEKILNCGETGEILVRGDQVMAGYFNKQAVNDSVLRDGWFRTGDLGRLSEDFELFVTGRLKSMIDINGKKVYPEDIEKHIAHHPDIAESAVIGVHDDRSGMAAMAFIRLKPGAAPMDEAAMKAFLKGNDVSRYEIPKHVVFVTEPLPRLRAGKLILMDIKAMAEAELQRRQAGTPEPDHKLKL